MEYLSFVTNLYAPSPVYRNQVVSHPLYVTAEEQHGSRDLIWVSSQNGYLFAVDPETLQDVFAVNIGSRMDGSPSLVQDRDGTPFIAVATAYDANNKGGTGALYIVNPRTGEIVDKSQPSGFPVTTAPIATSPGTIMFNDYNGNVFLYYLSGGQLSQQYQWNQVGGNGKTTNAEAGYAKGFYLLPFRSGDYTIAVNAGDTSKTPVKLGYLGQSVSAPTISKNYLYVADDQATVNQIKNDAQTYSSGGTVHLNFATGPSTQTLSNIMESTMQTPYGTQAPTLALGTSGGLQIWQNIGANYDFGTPVTETYVKGQKATFTKPLTLTLKENNLTQYPFSSDMLTLEYSVDGGSYQPLTTLDTYQGSTPSQTLSVPVNVLGQAAQTWTDGADHKVTFRVSAANTEAAYRFTGESGELDTTGTVTYTFTIGTGNAGSGTTGGGGNGGGAKTTMNLSIKYNPFDQPVSVGTRTIPVTVSNDGDEAVTTQVTLARNGFRSQKITVPSDYDDQGNLIRRGYYYYDPIADTQSYSQTVTLAPHSAKQLSFSVDTGRIIKGTSISSFYDDPTYSFQLVADINTARNPAETSYADNEAMLWVKTTGSTEKPPKVILVE